MCVAQGVSPGMNGPSPHPFQPRRGDMSSHAAPPGLSGGGRDGPDSPGLTPCAPQISPRWGFLRTFIKAMLHELKHVASQQKLEHRVLPFFM